MTHEEIDALPAGRELDALVAERVMGWQLVPAVNGIESPWWWDANGPVHSMDKSDWRGGWYPSTNIAAAWEVVERMGADGWDAELDQFHNFMHIWDACFRKLDNRDQGQWLELRTGRADAAPLAICRAALKAVASAAGGE